MRSALTLDPAALIPADVRACLVVGLDDVCPTCHQHVAADPVPVPQGLASWHEVKVTMPFDLRRGVEITLDRDLYWTSPLTGRLGWGLVDAQGRLLYWQEVMSRVAKGDQVWVHRE